MLALSATDGPQKHADWLEITALLGADGTSSISDLERLLRRSGTVDAVAPADTPGDIDRHGRVTEGIAEAAFSEIEDRMIACPNAYPFTIGDGNIQLNQVASNSVYIFLLLVSYFGHDQGPRGVRGDRLFEEVCFDAVRTSLVPAAMDPGAYLFAAPRRAEWQKGFTDAVTALVADLGEGEGVRGDRRRTAHTKDDGLDIVVWQSFPDRRAGRVMFFGQCATGKHWRTKLTDLSPQAWCEEWLKDQPTVKPTSMFFVPHRIAGEDWASHSRHGGVLFDRCRIAHCMPTAPAPLAERMRRWIEHHVPAQPAQPALAAG